MPRRTTWYLQYITSPQTPVEVGSVFLGPSDKKPAIEASPIYVDVQGLIGSYEASQAQGPERVWDVRAGFRNFRVKGLKEMKDAPDGTAGALRHPERDYGRLSLQYRHGATVPYVV